MELGRAKFSNGNNQLIVCMLRAHKRVEAAPPQLRVEMIDQIWGGRSLEAHKHGEGALSSRRMRIPNEFFEHGLNELTLIPNMAVGGMPSDFMKVIEAA